MEGKHTPGLWTPAPEGVWQPAVFPEDPEAEAAREAAAPDMLGALKAILADAEGYRRTHGAGAGATRRIGQRIDAARAAIAKAEGRAS